MSQGETSLKWNKLAPIMRVQAWAGTTKDENEIPYGSELKPRCASISSGVWYKIDLLGPLVGVFNATWGPAGQGSFALLRSNNNAYSADWALDEDSPSLYCRSSLRSAANINADLKAMVRIVIAQYGGGLAKYISLTGLDNAIASFFDDWIDARLEALQAPAQPTGTYSVSVPAKQFMRRGATLGVPLTLTSSGEKWTVTLTATGLGPGMAVSLNPKTTSAPGSVVATFTTNSSTPVGVYNIHFGAISTSGRVAGADMLLTVTY